MDAAEKAREILAVEIEIRGLITRHEQIAADPGVWGETNRDARAIGGGDRARMFGLFRRWSELTGTPIYFDDLLDEEERHEAARLLVGPR